MTYFLDCVYAGQTMVPGDILAMCYPWNGPSGPGIGSAALVFQSSDTNVVLYLEPGFNFTANAITAAVRQGIAPAWASGGPLWATGTAGQGGTDLQMQEDGNLCLYNGGTCIWSLSGQGGTPIPGSNLYMLVNGNIQVMSSHGVVSWQSTTAGAPWTII